MIAMRDSECESVIAKYRFLIETDSIYASYDVRQVMRDARYYLERSHILEGLPKFYKSLDRVKKFDE